MLECLSKALALDVPKDSIKHKPLWLLANVYIAPACIEPIWFNSSFFGSKIRVHKLVVPFKL